ncbi:hypothetical protein Q8F55_002131 [Vanrija albida]|uniref:UV radiation resistance-associated gene protein n=1 Tax=Vanrija albida TaxID=181172 RepID=A0ABR3Q8W9_9TREE
MEEEEKSSPSPSEPAPVWEPRIRQLSGLGIHELTIEAGFPVHGGGDSPRARRTSHAGLEVPISGRARAPTLAGEGYHHSPLPSLPTALEASVELRGARPLARCFVALLLPDGIIVTPTTTSPPVSPAAGKRPSSAAGSPAASPQTRTRTISLPPRPQIKTTLAGSAVPSATTSPTASPVMRRSQLNGSAGGRSRPPQPIRRSTLARASSEIGVRRPPPLQPSGPPPNVPFFFSSIHKPSTHPRWANIEPGDMAPWLSVPETASSVVEAQVWVEEHGKWRRLPGVGGVVDFTQLAVVPAGSKLPPNTIQWTFATHPKLVFYLPPAGSGVTPGPPRDAEKSVLERSIRETRMKKGANVGGIHQLVNIQSVIADTQRSVDDLQRQIESLITADADRSALRRDVSERALRVRWVKDRVADVERTIEETKARITLHCGRLDARRALLVAAAEREAVDKSRTMELASSITDVEDQRSRILPQIYRLRAFHAQILDSLFPITPISPPDLLYAVLGVPLPIPTGPKDPAPPLTLAPSQTPEGCPKVDERTTSAALGYAALIVHLISLLGGTAAALAYPVTYAGSRSHVRDVVSIMQGPRSFPLYGKGVERYRYEYAVFLLNKDIELLMHEADVRMLDLRHTLPNLKSLLLTLSSPDMPPPGPVGGPGWASGAASRNSSRQASSSFTPAFGRRGSTLRSTSITSLPPFTPSHQSTSLTAASVASVGPTDESGSELPASEAASGRSSPVREWTSTQPVTPSTLRQATRAPGAEGDESDDETVNSGGTEVVEGYAVEK